MCLKKKKNSEKWSTLSCYIKCFLQHGEIYSISTMCIWTTWPLNTKSITNQCTLCSISYLRPSKTEINKCIRCPPLTTSYISSCILCNQCKKLYPKILKLIRYHGFIQVKSTTLSFISIQANLAWVDRCV